MANPKKPEVGIRIHSEPEVAGKKKMAALPFHLLFVSDLTPQAPVPDDWANPSRLLSVDKNNFAEVMQQLATRLMIDAPNHVNDNPKTLELELQFPDLKAFRPEGVIAQVPALVRFFQLRTLVEQVKTHQLSLEEFPAQAEATGIDADLVARFHQLLLQPPTPVSRAVSLPSAESSVASRQPDTLDSLLGMVDLGTSEPAAAAKPASAVEALMQAITADEKGTVEKSAAELLLAELDGILGDQLNAILHHPQFQQLEAAWRSLKFLVDRLDFRQHTRLSVLPAAKEYLNDALYHQVLMPTHNGTVPELAAAPVSAIIADFAFAHTSEEVARLEDLAETMASLQAPLLANVAPAFFGKKSGRALEELPLIWQHLQRPEYVSWNKLRDNPATNFLVLALPRFLLRAAYGPENPVKDFQFVEAAGADRADHYVWGLAAVAIAASIARNFAATGWPTPLAASRESSRVENLALWDYLTSGTKARVPLEVKIPETKLLELSKTGIAALSCRLNDDAAYVAYAPTVMRPATYDDAESTEEARHHAMLGCQLVTCRIAHHLLQFEREMGAGLSSKNFAAELTDYFQALFKAGGHPLAPDAITVEISDHPERPERCYAAFRLLVPAAILGREISVVMGLELPQS